MKRLFPILAIAFVMAFGSVSATSYTNINTLTTTIVSPVQDEAASDDAEESIDTDGDRVGDNADNCPSVANAYQINVDGDGAGDLCDPDFDPDGDGIPNENLIVGDWRLNGAASIKVGPVPLDGSYYSVSEEEVLQRSCAFDDIFRFNADGTFNNIISRGLNQMVIAFRHRQVIEFLQNTSCSFFHLILRYCI